MTVETPKPAPPQELPRRRLPEQIGNSGFSLKDGVFFVAGATRAAIYDTNSGNVYSLNGSAKRILEGEIEDGLFWQQLIDLEVASPRPLSGVPKELPVAEAKLNFVWFEIMTADCNESCLHCYAGSMPPSYRREQGLPVVQPTQAERFKPRKLSYEQWCGLIGEAYALGCQQGQFIGGEPFLYRGEGGETVLDLARYAKSVGYEFIEIFTNATLVREEDVAVIKDLGLNIAVSLYSSQPEVHDAITRTPGSHQKTTRALRWLKDAGVPVRVATILMKQNQETSEATMELVKSLGFNGCSPDVLRPKGRGDNPEIQPDGENLVRYGLMLEPDFRADLQKLTHYSSGHSCLLGKLTITETGTVLPCIFSRTQAVGNVQVKPLREVIDSQGLKTFWRTTKDDVLVCRDCEYRYVCFDCRPLSENAAQGKSSYQHAPYPRCTYNPYTGEWARGVWKVDEDGRPYCDESLKPVIEKVRTEGNFGTKQKDIYERRR